MPALPLECGVSEGPVVLSSLYRETSIQTIIVRVQCTFASWMGTEMSAFFMVKLITFLSSLCVCPSKMSITL